jgi:hypothetical protein
LGYCKANITILEIVKVKKTLSRSGLMIHTMLVPALLIAPMFAVSASAQDSTASAEDDSTTVVVTGSRLKTRDIKAISPVSTVTSETTGPTGVEMEALCAVSVALLTVYDMLKAVDRGMLISEIKLLEKSGGQSGLWQAK